MLCYRCEYRAQFLETGRRPRFECGEIEKSKYVCYMYRPVKPIVLKRSDAAKDDPRPEHAGYFGCRMEGTKVLDNDNIHLAIEQLNEEESVEFWVTQRVFDKIKDNEKDND